MKTHKSLLRNDATFHYFTQKQSLIFKIILTCNGKSKKKKSLHWKCDALSQFTNVIFNPLRHSELQFFYAEILPELKKKDLCLKQ